jgi:hypothetical protein
MTSIGLRSASLFFSFAGVGAEALERHHPGNHL